MEITSETLKRMSEHRPVWPKRAVVTSGMPYGNKSLHCGHITLFIHSDFFARFLRDRIGSENVIYVSGTDCYGSPALEGYRKVVEKKEFEGSITDYVQKYHKIAPKQHLLVLVIMSSYSSKFFKVFLIQIYKNL